MATYKFSGDYDKVSAELKKTLETQKASFDASLNTLFKPKPAAKKPAAPTAPVNPHDWAQKADLSRSSRRDDGDTVRSRLQTSTRSR